MIWYLSVIPPPTCFKMQCNVFIHYSKCNAMFLFILFIYLIIDVNTESFVKMNLLTLSALVPDKASSVQFLQQRGILHNPRICPLEMSLSRLSDGSCAPKRYVAGRLETCLTETSYCSYTAGRNLTTETSYCSYTAGRNLTTETSYCSYTAGRNLTTETSYCSYTAGRNLTTETSYCSYTAGRNLTTDLTSYCSYTAGRNLTTETSYCSYTAGRNLTTETSYCSYTAG